MELTRGRVLLPPAGGPTGGVPVATFADLDAVERAQLVACAGRGADVVFTLEELFQPDFAARGDDHAWIAETAEVPIEWWDVVDEGRGLYRFVILRVDCGFLLRAGTTEIIADAPQCGSSWEGLESWSASERKEFSEAHRRCAAENPRSQIASFHPCE